MGTLQTNKLDTERVQQAVANVLKAMSSSTEAYERFTDSLVEFGEMRAALKAIVAEVECERVRFARIRQVVDQMNAQPNARAIDPVYGNGSDPNEVVAVPASDWPVNGQHRVPLRRGRFAVKGTMTQPMAIEQVLRAAAPATVDKDQLLAGVEALGVKVHSSVPARRPAMIGQRAKTLVDEKRLPIEQVRPGHLSLDRSGRPGGVTRRLRSGSRFQGNRSDCPQFITLSGEED